ncbi:hypothetical protein [Streptomyces graminilatus]|uniref:hypothetical protein n=1 Tax=Streptomyces graminilatus TaxID=1464070 RepID=UPI000A5E61D1|nr:hypothetical protein [Streptomyces graminilatus]
MSERESDVSQEIHESQEDHESHEDHEGREAQSVSPPGGRVRRVRFAAVAGSVVLAGALVAGVVDTVVTVRAADRDAGAPTWKFPKRQAEKKATARPGLAGMLVPYGRRDGAGGITSGSAEDAWVRGPDVVPFGSDVELGGAEATALRKESLSGLPRAQREKLEGMIDRRRIKGLVARSYFRDRTYAYVNGMSVSSVTVVLVRMDRSAARDSATFQNRFLDASGLFRKGAKIKGHDNARCFQPLKGGDKKELGRMLCSASVGDILVTVTAYGAQPLDTEGITTMMRAQLDRIVEPGEAV